MNNQWFAWSVVSVSAATGLRLERTAIGRSLSGPVCAMLVSAILTNIGVIPPQSSHLLHLTSFVVKLATPFLLFRADLRKILRETGDLLKAFLLGTFSTLLGSILAYFLFLPQLSLIGAGQDGWKIVAALTSKNIGGGLNFVAVADELKVSPQLISTGLTVDNIVGLLYFPFISWLGKVYEKPIALADHSPATVGGDNSTCLGISATVLSPQADVVTVDSTITALTIGLSIVALSEIMSAVSGCPSTSISTALTVGLATLLPQRMSIVVPAGDLMGRVLLMLFFGSVGNAAGTLTSLTASADVGTLLLFELAMYVVHLVAILGLGGALGMSRVDLLLASNANIGNAATATALASAKGWQKQLVPAMLVGTFGNIIATFIGLAYGGRILQPLSLL